MPPNSRSLLRGTARLPNVLRHARSQAPRRFLATSEKPTTIDKIDKGPSSEQVLPLGAYYEWILIKPPPIPEVKPEEPPTSSPKSPRTTVKKTPAKKTEKEAQAQELSSPTATPESTSPTPSAQPATAQEKARIIFGSRLAGPAERAERLEALRTKSRLVAGVLVPPRPEEPDNCCMSGCVNCVWDIYRDDMEAWAGATARAEAALLARTAGGASAISAAKGQTPVEPAPASSLSMDDDGGGSETNWPVDMAAKSQGQGKIAKDFWNEDLYKNVPVGIREFMKTEKKLKDRHLREGTIGG